MRLLSVLSVLVLSFAFSCAEAQEKKITIEAGSPVYRLVWETGKPFHLKTDLLTDLAFDVIGLAAGDVALKIGDQWVPCENITALTAVPVTGSPRFKVAVLASKDPIKVEVLLKAAAGNPFVEMPVAKNPFVDLGPTVRVPAPITVPVPVPVPAIPVPVPAVGAKAFTIEAGVDLLAPEMGNTGVSFFVTPPVAPSSIDIYGLGKAEMTVWIDGKPLPARAILIPTGDPTRTRLPIDGLPFGSPKKTREIRIDLIK